MLKTQKKIATATKELVVSVPFDAVSVTAIMKQAQLRRQTFYDFYRDKYDVLAWIYQTEVGAAATKCETFRYWTQTVDQLLHYFQDNQTFYQRIFALDTQNAPETIIKAHFKTMIKQILADLAQTKHFSVDNRYSQFLQTALSTALYATINDWLTDQDRLPLTEERQFICNYLQDGIDGLTERQHPDSHSQLSVKKIR
ncbi:dihydroxyacetone kinase transcriptional activator DhaS [uncultured Secundilactobacillus sp.]|uniref:dihydroxyacetone kinase transcriptional activator DhaS n=1 Tax=uncultured Secundilactobacillus sp. TaxID=2813935 RepID=UPI002588F749|nr:dihydroxyacetone kinase transcriptional activator DhaS [uncultured Secundilactobacillus sp.]